MLSCVMVPPNGSGKGSSQPMQRGPKPTPIQQARNKPEKSMQRSLDDGRIEWPSSSSRLGKIANCAGQCNDNLGAAVYGLTNRRSWQDQPSSPLTHNDHIAVHQVGPR